MKKTIFSIVALTAMGLGTASAVDFTSVNNLAAGCAVEVSSNPGEKATITDGNLVTRWQASGSRTYQDWFMVDLGEEKEFTDIEITWEASFPTVYDIYVTEEKPTIVAVEESAISEQYISEEWLNAQTPAFDDQTCSVAGAVTSTSEAKVSGQYILVYTREYSGNAQTYGSSPFELRVADLSEVANQISSIQLSDVSVAKGGTVEVTVSAKTMAGEAVDLSRLDSITLTCSDAEAVTITDVEKGKFSVTGNKFGYYTMTATAVGEGSTFEATANLAVAYDWDAVTNIAQGKPAYASHNNAIAYQSVDGDFGTRWETGGNVTSGVKYYVDLGTEYNISAIGFNWDAAYCNQYKLYYAPNGVEISGEDGVNNEAWVEFLSVDRVLANANKNTDTNILDTPVKARYVMIESVETQIWGMSFYEMLIAGELANEVDPNKVTSIKLEDIETVQGVRSTVNVVAYNELLEVIANPEMTTTLTANSADVVITENEDGTYSVSSDVVGSYTLTATATAGESQYTATAKMTVNINWDVTGNIALNKPSFASHNSENSYQSNDDNLNSRWIPGGGATGDTAWWYVDLGFKYNVNIIEIIWEGAYAKSYEVLYATELDENGEPVWNETPIYSQSKELTGFPYADTHMFDAVEARYIKLQQKENGYGDLGMSMWEVRVAGTLAEEVNIAIATDENLVSNVTTTSAIVSFTVNVSEAAQGRTLVILCDGEEVKKVENASASEVFTHELTGLEMNTLYKKTYVASVDGVESEPCVVEFTTKGMAPVSFPTLIITGEWTPEITGTVSTGADKKLYFEVTVTADEYPTDFNKIEVYQEKDSEEVLIATLTVPEVASYADGMVFTGATTNEYTDGDYVVFYLSLLDGATKTNKLGYYVGGGTVSGIRGVEAVANGEAVYYNFQGVRVANPENGVYIRVQNGKATKVIVK